jgi:hypothetical protein
MAAINDAGRFPVDAGRFRSLHDGNLEESTFPGISINPVRLGFQLGITEQKRNDGVISGRALRIDAAKNFGQQKLGRAAMTC